MMAPISRRAAASVVVLALMGMEATETSRLRDMPDPDVRGGRRLLQDRLMPWAMRVTTCQQLREALQWEGLPRIIILAPIACTVADWPEPVVVTWNLELMGGSGWDTNPRRGIDYMASIEWSGVKTAVMAMKGAELYVHSLVLHQDVMQLDIPQFKVVEANVVYAGLAVSASSCADGLDGYIDGIQRWGRPEEMDGSQRARPFGPRSLLVEDAAKMISVVHGGSIRVCESAFVCGPGNSKIHEVFRGELVRDVCLGINVTGQGDSGTG